MTLVPTPRTAFYGNPPSPDYQPDRDDLIAILEQLDTASQAQRYWVTPTDFGAVAGTVSAAQRTANTTALNSAHASDKPLVYDAIYEVDGPVTQQKTGKAVHGITPGMSGLLSYDASGDTLTFGSATQTNCVLENLSVNAAVQKDAGAFDIVFNNCARVTVHNVFVSELGIAEASRLTGSGVQIKGSTGNMNFDGLYVYGSHDTVGTAGTSGLVIQSEVNNASEIVFKNLNIRGFTNCINLRGGTSVKIISGDASSGFTGLKTSADAGHINRELFLGPNFSIDRCYNVGFQPGANSLDYLVSYAWMGGCKTHNVLINTAQSGAWFFANSRMRGTATGASVVVDSGDGHIITFQGCEFGLAGNAALAADYAVTQQNASGLVYASGHLIATHNVTTNNTLWGIQITGTAGTQQSYRIKDNTSRGNAGAWNSTDSGNENATSKFFIFGAHGNVEI